MTTAKAWRQKGTGRARAGALSVPHRYGGGAAFGPKPRHYTVKVNRKARRKALRAALTVHAERDSIAVLDGSTYDAPATKQAATALSKWGAQGPTLVVVGVRGGGRRQELPEHPGHHGRARERRRGGRRRRRLLAGRHRGGSRGAQGEGEPLERAPIIGCEVASEERRSWG